MVKRREYIPEFIDFWSANPAVEKIWMSIFTPQRGASNIECLTFAERSSVVETLLRVRREQRKLDMLESAINEFLSPPGSPEQCIFAQTTRTLSADFTTRVEPCQFGGDPDCSRCGCYASMGLAAVGRHKLGPITTGGIFWASHAIGRKVLQGEELIRGLISQKKKGPGKKKNQSISERKNLLKVIGQ